MAAARRRRPATRSRLTALGLAAGALMGLVLGMAASGSSQSPSQPVTAGAPGSAVAPGGSADAPTSPFAGRPSITQTGAS